jgi:hypothetical protein
MVDGVEKVEDVEEEGQLILSVLFNFLNLIQPSSTFPLNIFEDST